MHPVIASLRDLMETDPLPAEHTSSHWQRYGRDTVVEGQEELVLEAAGFSSQRPPTLVGKLFDWAERASYAGVTRQLDAYPSVRAEALRLARALNRGAARPARVPQRFFWSAARLSHERIFTTAMAVLTDHFTWHRLSPRVFAVIGDGDGFFGALARRCFPGITLYCIDLPKQLVFQAATHEKASPGAAMSVRNGGTAIEADIIFVPPQHIDRIDGPIDCAVNLSSMQEMTPASIARYFAFLRQRATAHSRFYCVNMRRKALVGGEVTAFAEYPWQPDDEVFLDGPCPYFTHYIAPLTLSYGPRVLNLRVPYVNSFGDVVMHRLVRLAPGKR